MNTDISQLNECINDYIGPNGSRNRLDDRLRNVNLHPFSQEARATRAFMQVHDKFVNLAIMHRNALRDALDGRSDTLQALRAPNLEQEAIVEADTLATELLRTSQQVDTAISMIRNVIQNMPDLDIRRQLEDACDQMILNHTILADTARRLSKGNLDDQGIHTKNDLTRHVDERKEEYRSSAAEIRRILEICRRDNILPN